MKLEELLTKTESDYESLTEQRVLHLQALQRIEKRLLQLEGKIEALKELATDDDNSA